MKKSCLCAYPIGRVEKNRIRIHKKWFEALDGLEDFSHIIVLSWLNEARKPDLKIHPKGFAQLPLVGLFATRSPHRPNPIGVTVVQLLKRKGNLLYVKNLDAWEGTPVLDIKPYTKKDSIKKFKIASWVKLLDKLEKDPLRRYAQ